MIAKTQPLCTGAKSNLGDRVRGEVESKGDTVDLSPSKLHIPTWRNLSFIAVLIKEGKGCRYKGGPVNNSVALAQEPASRDIQNNTFQLFYRNQASQ